MGRSSRRLVRALALVALGSCASRQRAGSQLASQCEIQHTMRGADSIEGRVDRIEEGWLVSLRMRVRLADGEEPIEVRGLGRVRRSGSAATCQVVEAGGQLGSPRFDEALCLDEFETLTELLESAEQAARPGETVVQEVSLNPRHRRRTRSRVTASVHALQEHAEIARDAEGRIIRVARSSDQGDREEILVSYPPGIVGHCIRIE